ncbi:MAG: carboxypeptidase regulatory-like domain-containing protein [Deltaproteobacteria bacterium]|mgnify:CR=1 FL=1|jgi:hypothetical protein|nr:carboxypeptidase regulatory-like domain-containing protein [Deltaproteobacteria bacterium]MBT4525090.1 carboxypeptidase regulatory-like domain-containing protein [Deltaproteobacteria bacterium]
MKHFLIILLLSFFFNFIALAENDKLFDISGIIRDGKGHIVTDAKVNLLLIEMASPPKIATTSETKSDQEGAYVFKNRQAVAGFFYRISAEKDGRETVSSPFRAAKQGNTITIDLRLPDISTDQKELVFDKELLVFDLGNDYLRVTNVYHLLNRSNAILNLKQSPYKIHLPREAKNVVVLKQPEGSDYEIGTDFIVFRLHIKPGPQQILFSYHLPSDSSYQMVDHDILPGMAEVEVITPATGISADLFPQGSDQIIERKKTFDKESYISKTIQFKEERKMLRIKISGFPTPQIQMLIPAVIITCLLFLGLGIYIIRNAKNLNQK